MPPIPFFISQFLSYQFNKVDSIHIIPFSYHLKISLARLVNMTQEQYSQLNCLIVINIPSAEMRPMQQSTMTTASALSMLILKFSTTVCLLLPENSRARNAIEHSTSKNLLIRTLLN